MYQTLSHLVPDFLSPCTKPCNTIPGFVTPISDPDGPGRTRTDYDLSPCTNTSLHRSCTFQSPFSYSASDITCTFLYFGRPFTSLQALNKHVSNVHENNIIKKENCHLCEKSFITKVDLKRHVISVRDKIKAFECNTCEKSFSRKHHLVGHFLRVHEKVKNHKCELCEKCFFDKRHLNKHINSVHIRIKPYKCDICEMDFSTTFDLRNHYMPVHNRLKRFKCETCEKAFSSTESLNKHITTQHHGSKNFRCEKCSQSFSVKAFCKCTLSTYILIHANYFSVRYVKNVSEISVN